MTRGDASCAHRRLSLSLGYYHEQPDDITFDPKLLEPLHGLGALGVAVVVAAGNDATDRPDVSRPPSPRWPGGPVTVPEPGCVPLVSVGALNPNGTVALFSNAGEWVQLPSPGRRAGQHPPATSTRRCKPAERRVRTR